MTACVFCDIINGSSPATVVAKWPGVWAITPLDPAAEGHVLVIPERHVADFTTDPNVTTMVMHAAALLGWEIGGDLNLITSKGEAASQSVAHLHAHLVPRHAGDGLALPWDPQPARMVSIPAPARSLAELHRRGWFQLT